METRFCYSTELYTECRHFYEGVLGWSIDRDWDRSPQDKGVVYHAGTALLEILSGPASRLDGGFYLYLEVADIETLHVALTKAGINPPEPVMQPWGHINFSVQDPAGLTLKFFTRIP